MMRCALRVYIYHFHMIMHGEEERENAVESISNPKSYIYYIHFFFLLACVPLLLLLLRLELFKQQVCVHVFLSFPSLSLAASISIFSTLRLRRCHVR